MKKLASILVTLMVLLLPVAAVMAVTSASASVTGPSVIRAGDTLTVSVLINGSGLSAVRGEIQFDAGQVEYQSTGSYLSGWSFDFDSKTGSITFLGSDDKLTAPISSQKQLFKMTYKVKSSIAAGAVIRIKAAKLEASDGSSDIYPSDASYSVTVAPPLSTNADLASLSVDHGTLSPAFAKTTTQYTLSVPFDVASLKVTAKADDAGAKIKVNSPALKAGGTTQVTVTVTAASGAQKTYNIRVSRAQDPDYVPDNNSSLAEITVAEAALSPSFSTERLEYVVYVPYEVEALSVSAAPASGKADVSVEGQDQIAVGHENRILITCQAEDGSTSTYTIAVVRAEAFNDIDSLTPTTTIPETTPEPTTTVQTTTEQTTAATTTQQETTAPLETTTANNPSDPGTSGQTGQGVFIIALAVVALLEAGYIIYLIVTRRNA